MCGQNRQQKADQAHQVVVVQVGEVMVRLNIQRANPTVGEKAGNDQDAQHSEDDPERCC